ncbi:hypothetical protein, partial [Endozoicomonas sp. SESOKO1]|uniref:hypothetical protein n=1 Tax=Endozoicomonas sp. SESOKO1 TaxID=2828742 RepID=UPI002149822D
MSKRCRIGGRRYGIMVVLGLSTNAFFWKTCALILYGYCFPYFVQSVEIKTNKNLTNPFFGYLL